MKKVGYFDDPNNVRGYIKMTKRYDGRELIQNLIRFLPPGSTVLELGMGPGKDLDILKKHYTAVGSDNSQAFLDLYRKANESADVLFLDAITLQTELRFDCIYSNKVLHHLKPEELRLSVGNQVSSLNPKGLVFHSFWKGNGEEFFHRLRFAYYQEEEILAVFEREFQILEMVSYRESRADDSIYLIAQVKQTYD